MIVGTAGHVDHGKTTLVRCLTGIDTDRLKEEKARGITTDLGFAWMPGPDGQPIGFVDVPGHESLVRTMVAGVAGIDLALIVVAADEGVKPQTREHVEILRLLGLENGLVAITKADRADARRREATLAEIAATLTPFFCEPPLFVSAVTGEGLDVLRSRLASAALRRTRQPAGGVFRMAVDRAFTLRGVGTVAAGTIVSGRVAVDDTVTILPGGIAGRVRSLEVHNRPSREGHRGERCALALAGVERGAVARGAWVCGEVEPAETMRLDVELRLCGDEPRALGAWTPVHFHCGASDIPARVTPLSGDKLGPGATGFAQIVLTSALPLRHGDRVILRDTSARRTIGGGRVVDPRAPARRRRTADRLDRLAMLAEPDPMRALDRLTASGAFEDLDGFTADRGMGRDEGRTLADRLGLSILAGQPTVFVATPATICGVDAAIQGALAEAHARHPERAGLDPDELRKQLTPAPAPRELAALCAWLIAEGRLARRGHWLHLPGHEPRLGDEDQRIADLMLPLIEKDRFRPPRVRDLGASIAFHETKVRATCKALAGTGVLVEVAPDHFFTATSVAEMAAIARRLTALSADGAFSAADFRDALANGRKVAIQILEFFDRRGLTRRIGDRRSAVATRHRVHELSL